jgi:hypothetical protein
MAATMFAFGNLAKSDRGYADAFRILLSNSLVPLPAR